MTSATGALVVGLRAAGAAGARLVGHKAATLGRLAAAGFSVPEGLVLTAEALTAVLEQNRLGRDVGADDIELAGWPAMVAMAVDEIAAHFGGAALAVRSSAAAEDLPEESFAGQYTTVLRVRGDGELRAAVRSCWASAFTGRVRGYQGSTAGQSPVRLAVLVQRLVDADVAGVAFTADPVTGDRDAVLVSAVPGTAEHLVDGSVDPDQWVVRADGPEPVSVTQQALTERQAASVAELARRLETELGGPQDMEWAMADQRLLVLQSRPVTALPRPPVVELPPGTWVKEVQHYPEPLTAFGASLVGPLVTGGLTELSSAWGGLVERFEGRVVGGEPYVRALPVGGHDGPPPPWWVLGALTRVVPPLRRRMRTAARMLRPGMIEHALDDWEQVQKPGLRREHTALLAVDLAQLDDAALDAHFGRVVDHATRCLRLHFWLIPPYAVPLHDLCEVCRLELGWGTAATLRLLAGTSPMTSAPYRALRRVAELVRTDPAATALVAQAPPDLADRLDAVAPEVAQALREWTTEYGVRSLHDDPGSPTLLESPALVAAMLREVAATSHRNADSAAGTRQEATAEARRILATRPARVQRRFEQALALARRSHPLREDSAFWTGSMPGGLLRLAMAESGRRLAARGVLHSAEDAAHLDVGTLRAALSAAETPEAGEVRRTVARNRAERLWTIHHPGPPYHGPAPADPPDFRGLPRAGRRLNQALDWVHGSGNRDVGPASPVPDATLLGLAGSPGTHTGTVRVLLGTSDFGRLRRGDVLVCRTADPAWSVLFGIAGALVTDRGGVLSHAAIVAREQGLPAVLATGHATRALPDGATVTVDGTNGRVVLHDDAVRKGSTVDDCTGDIAASGAL